MNLEQTSEYATLLHGLKSRIQAGLLEIEADDDLETSRQRKKGLDANP